MSRAAVLFAREDSIYKSIQGLDVYDINRHARTFDSDLVVIAHPPCRAWGRLRAFARPRFDEKALAHRAVHLVRRNGGVIEHPEASTLWLSADLPRPGETDFFGGWTLPIHQHWFGHRARKATWLYIVGVQPRDIPPIPLMLGGALSTVEKISKQERESTPEAFALWLIDLSESVQANRPSNTRNKSHK